MNTKEQNLEAIHLQTNSQSVDIFAFKSRSVFITGVIEAELALRINRELLALEKADNKAPIIAWINSPGGEVYSGFSIYDTIQFIKPRVITVVSGMAASTGSVISLAAEKEDRLIFPRSKILLHQPLIGGTISGPASDIAIHAKDIMDLKQKMHFLYAERTGTPVEKFIEMMDRDRWVSPEEARELGLISKIIYKREELDALIA
jgi:ATP-dependent Clp protease protease subunit